MKVLTFVSRCDLKTALNEALISAQFVVETAGSVKECLQFARFEQYKGVLVDSEALSFGDIVVLVRLLRQENPHATVFVLARYLDLEQRLRLFEAGVDDCSCGEVFASELTMRFRVSIRLHQAAASPAGMNTPFVLRSGDLELDLIHRSAKRMGKVFDLRPREFQLLEYLVRNANRPVTRAMILEQVWNSSFEGLTNVVDVYISALRRKLDRGSPRQSIQTNHGVGYTFISAEASREPNAAADVRATI